MSGIAGIYSLKHTEPERSSFQAMVDILAHRGPDNSGTWIEQSVGLGHRLLKTSSFDNYDYQPFMVNGLVIISDSRIDNRKELIRILELGSERVNKLPDCQIILAAYQKWGNDCPIHLLGDFSFAIWNRRKQEFFCARDPYGG